MNEELLQFIWRFQYFQTGNLYSTHGERVKIIRPGDWNRNQGPDFLAASVFVGQTQWVGNIEIHVLASDWHKHNHQKDERYSGIILHVVWKNDVTIKDNYGNDIPTVVLESHVPKILLDRYEKLMQAKQPILCAGFLPFLDELSWGAWKERLMVERLERKAGLILQQLQKLKGDWEELSWQKLTANFGIKVNEPVFEQLAASLPFKRLIKHRTNRLDIEALLYGQSNLLKRIYTDSYPVDLLNVYSFLSKKYKLKPIQLQPAFLRMRPIGFPTLRLSQLAAWITQRETIFSTLMEAKNISELINLCRVAANDYWYWHYRFDESTDWHDAQLGRFMAENMVINTAIPLMYAYGIFSRQSSYQLRTIQWLYQMQAERNRIVNAFSTVGVNNRSALDSQSLLELNKFYCTEKKCLSCMVGNKIFKTGVFK